MYPENPDDASLHTSTDSHLPPSAQDPKLKPPISTRTLRRILATFSVLLVLVLLTLTLLAVALRRDLRANLLANQGLLDGTVPVAGLSAPVTVTRDAQAVPTIHAANLDDLLFAQGYITASDRLFQMDALRRHGAGTLAEILGGSLLQHDREQRILQLRAAADRALTTLPPDQLHQLQAYANGVNAYINSHDGRTHNGATSPNALPIEFHIFHYLPDPWQPRDSLLIGIVMAQDLATGFPEKLHREAFSRNLPPNLLADLYPVGSWRDHPPTQQPPDLTAPSAPVEQIPLDNTQSRLATPPHPTLPVRAVPGCPTHTAVSSRDEWAGDNSHCPTPNFQTTASPDDLLSLYHDLHHHQCDGCSPGSNNWVVSGSHTATGAPLLSNDMHLGLTAPDIWYEASLHADTASDASSATTGANSTLAVRAGPLNVEGFTLPGVPFVIVGRNANVSWGFTNSGADVQDVLVEHLRKQGTTVEYERPDHIWLPVQHHTEVIRVRAGRDVTLDVLTTAHSIGAATIQTPIITPLFKTERRALALAWTVYDPSTLTTPFLAINSATDAASLVAAFAGFGSVSQNLVYADAHHIGYHLIGRIPIRGPATQRPRAVQPFVLPDAIPPSDEEDESGDTPTASLQPNCNALPIPTAGCPIHTAAPSRDEWAATNLPASTPHLTLASFGAPQRFPRTPRPPVQTTPSAPSTTQLSPSAQDYTIGSPLSPIPVDALDTTQTWSGYIPYDALPSVLDPTSGIIATANARITPDDYPYYIADNWADPYRVERINHLLDLSVTANHPLTPADMLRIQMDVHSEFDLLVAQRLAYALDHSALTKKDPRLQQAANLLRDWNGDVSATSPAADLATAAFHEIWPMLLAPQVIDYDNTRYHVKLKDAQVSHILNLYTWAEDRTALELILQNTPARWLPHGYPNWNDLLTTAVERSFRILGAQHDLSRLSYGKDHPVDIGHAMFGSHSPISTLLGVPTGTGPQPTGGDATTVKAAGLHFGPSERFTADLSNPDNTHANLPTGESGNPASPHFLDQFQPWLKGTTFLLPLNHPTIQHTLTLTPN